MISIEQNRYHTQSYSFESGCISIGTTTISVLLDGTETKLCGTLSQRSGVELRDQTYVFSCGVARANAVKIKVGNSDKFLTIAEVVIFRTGNPYLYAFGYHFLKVRLQVESPVAH